MHSFKITSLHIVQKIQKIGFIICQDSHIIKNSTHLQKVMFILLQVFPNYHTRTSSDTRKFRHCYEKKIQQIIIK